MSVHWSDRVEEAVYQPVEDLKWWPQELSFLRYGLGNFYSVEGVVTHYHNWYDRVSDETMKASNASGQKRFFPSDYIRAYTLAFLKDLADGRVVIPRAETNDRRPVAL